MKTEGQECARLGHEDGGTDYEAVLREAVNALVQRRTALANVFATTTNPLDRLSYKDRMDEIDNCLRYLN